MRLALSLVIFSLAGVATAEQPPLPQQRPAEWHIIKKERAQKYKNVRTWLEQLKQDAQKEGQGISDALFDDIFHDFKPNQAIIKLQKRQPEFTLTLQEYLDLVVTTERKEKAQTLYQDYQPLLMELSETYGVAGNYLIALWGVESAFGERQGTHIIPHALATLAYGGARRDFFRKELLIALKILQEQNIPFTHMRGSWAGAMGQVQFMPSTYQAYAQDWNNDKRKDIWRNPQDALASAAHFLNKIGWKGKNPAPHQWGIEVTAPTSFKRANFGLKKKPKSLKEWRRVGVVINNASLLEDNTLAWLIFPERKSRRAFLVFAPFKTLLRWNRSDYFAIAVGTLADSIIVR